MRRHKALATGLAAVLAGASCTPFHRGLRTETNYQRFSKCLSSPENVKGHELRRVTERDERYKIEGVVINGRQYYEQINSRPQEGELNTYLVPRENAIVQIDREAGKVTLDSDILYVLIPVKVKDLPAHSLPLVTDGKFGIRTINTYFNTDSVESGIFGETQADRRMNILTITLGAKTEFYHPRVDSWEEFRLNQQVTEGKTPDALPFYLVPVKGTRKDIAPDGKITLRSAQGIFRPVLVMRAAYEARGPSSGKTSGQAEEPGE